MINKILQIIFLAVQYVRMDYGTIYSYRVRKPRRTMHVWQQMCVYTQLAYIAVFFQQSYHLLHIRMTINAYRVSYYFSEVLVSIVLNDCPSASGIQAQRVLAATMFCQSKVCSG